MRPGSLQGAWFLRATVLLTAFFLLLTARPAVSETAKIEDYSGDGAEYREAVASISSERKDSRDRLVSRSGVPAIVICRTDGSELLLHEPAPVRVIMGPRNCYTLVFSSGAEAEAWIRETAGDEGLIYAERDQPVTACETGTGDPGTDSVSFHSWAAEAMKMDELAALAASAGQGSASVAVIDSGVSAHPFLRGRILKQGYDYVDGDNDSSNDGTGHGTRVAGILTDCTPGAPVKIIPIRVLDEEGYGLMSNLVNAVEEAAEDHVTLIHLSLAATSHSEALHCAIRDALSAGVCVVASAGNQGTNAGSICPAHMSAEGMITVGSIEADGSRSSWSNYGSCVDVFCYGSGISCCDLSGDFSTESGTSMAAPHVTAICAMFKTIHPELGAGALKNRLKALRETETSAPDASAAVPRELGLCLRGLRMQAGQALPVPQSAAPASCHEVIRWESDTPETAYVQDDLLHAGSAGTATVQASCLGLDPVTLNIRVDDGETGTMVLFAERIGAEAFSGDPSLRFIRMEEGVTDLETACFAGCGQLSWVCLPGGTWKAAADAFDENTDAVFFCRSGTDAALWAAESGYQYVLIP